MAYLNVDRAERDCCIHGTNCQEVQNHSGGTDLKPAGRIGDDGGWLPFPTSQDARAYAQANHPTFNIHDHC
jgi:hypothetical protein